MRARRLAAASRSYAEHQKPSHSRPDVATERRLVATVDSSRCSGASSSTRVRTSLILSILLFLLPQLLLHNARRQPRRRHAATDSSEAARAADGCTPWLCITSDNTPF
jgi:hypothetical protein